LRVRLLGGGAVLVELALVAIPERDGNGDFEGEEFISR